jgi:hypothetical protein
MYSNKGINNSELIKLWENPIIQIPCCRCFKLLKYIKLYLNSKKKEYWKKRILHSSDFTITVFQNLTRLDMIRSKELVEIIYD